jgi:hypothetical protein
MTNAIEDGCVGDSGPMGRFRELAANFLPTCFLPEIMDGVDKKNLPQSWIVNVDEKRHS